MKRFWTKIQEIGSLTAQTYNELLDDKVYKMTAALSYYTLFSLAPLLMIAIAVAGFIFGEEAAQGEIVAQVQSLIGRSGAEVIESLIQNTAEDVTGGVLATIISIVIIILASVGVFVEIKESLNIIWGVEPKPGQPIKNLIKTRLGAFTMVLVIGFMLLVSLVISAILSAIGNFLGNSFPASISIIEILNIIVTFLLITILFAVLFKYLPDVRIRWRYVWMGAIITSVLFNLGKYLIGLYLGNTSYSSTFGAAGSLVVLMLWLNYSGLIFFFGAEFTQIYRRTHTDDPLKADPDGIIIPKVSHLIKKEVRRNRKSKKQQANEKSSNE